MNLAPIWKRACASAIDVVLVPLLTLLLVVATGTVEHAEDFANRWWMLWVLLEAIAAYLILNGWWLWRGGQTLGKKIFQIKIVMTDQTPVPLWRLILVRAWFFPLLYLVFLGPWAAIPVLDQISIIHRSRRCLHDWISGTMVVSCET